MTCLRDTPGSTHYEVTDPLPLSTRPLVSQLVALPKPIMELSHLAVPSVYFLIFFLGYPSQWLLMHLEPAPLTKKEIIASNVILTLIWITYTRSVFVDPGSIARDWVEQLELEKEGVKLEEKEAVGKSKKWCRKCDAAKPPRAHHCKECRRYIRTTLHSMAPHRTCSQRPPIRNSVANMNR